MAKSKNGADALKKAQRGIMVYVCGIFCLSGAAFAYGAANGLSCVLLILGVGLVVASVAIA